MNRYYIIKSLDKLLDRSIVEEVNLWREVIRQAFIDLLVISKNKKYNATRKEAYQWLSARNKDYFLVCMLAQVKEESVNSLFKEARKIYNNYLRSDLKQIKCHQQDNNKSSLIAKPIKFI